MKTESETTEKSAESAVDAVVIPTIERVKEWHLAFGVPICGKPHIAYKQINELRLKLIREETDELEEALQKGDKVAVLDALCDLQYVLDGTFLSLGFHELKHKGVDEVHRSNMSKLDDDGNPVYREDGKVLKGPNFQPPKLSELLV